MLCNCTTCSVDQVVWYQVVWYHSYGPAGHVTLSLGRCSSFLTLGSLIKCTGAALQLHVPISLSLGRQWMPPQAIHGVDESNEFDY